ncbi:MAG TPA: hybrid sensor histidine kinase/response regulator [Trichocoleus sp.]|jgi:signal transduction histidine kinase
MSGKPAKPLADILIVDDVPDNLLLLSSLLTEYGYKVRKVVTGESALAEAQASPPDLILLDIMMPQMDGYEVCRRLKANQKVQHVPVIFLSARNEAADKVEGFSSGGVDYITKPFNLEEVIARVQNQLRISRLQQSLRQEVRDRIEAQSALEALNQDLENRVKARTAELQQRNEQLLLLQAQLKEALVQEHALNELKSQLLTTISHEFSTPLSIIATASEILKLNRDEADDVKDDRWFQMISDSVNRINQTLKNTMTLTTAESQAIQFCPEPTDLTQWCRNLIENWKLPPDSLHRLDLVVTKEAMPLVSIDVTLMQQLVSNLIQNAIRFSPEGGSVTLQITYQPTQVILSIQDQGIGIPDAEQSQVFDQFFRASNANSVPGTPGAGLGLAVVQWIVKLHHGSVAIDSSLHQGTTVKVMLPRTQAIIP